MKITFFGIYSKNAEYPRQKNLIESLINLDLSINECHFSILQKSDNRLLAISNLFRLISSAILIIISYFSLTFKFLLSPAPDVVIVLHPGIFHMPLVKFLCSMKNKEAIIVYDSFFSIYYTIVEDRKVASEKSLLAKTVKFFESNSLNFSDINIIDTLSHADYLSDLFYVDRNKFKRVLVGSTLKACGPNPYPKKNQNTIDILFVGTYIPLHGIEYIVEAAKYLSDLTSIQFHIIGAGQLKDDILKLSNKYKLNNLSFRDWVPANELCDHITTCDIGLGIFGSTEKAQRVIPIKIYDLCSTGKPIITADTPAIREFFTHRVNAYLVPPGDARALADGILELSQNSSFRRILGSNALKLAFDQFSQESIGLQLLDSIQTVIKERH